MRGCSDLSACSNQRRKVRMADTSIPPTKPCSRCGIERPITTKFFFKRADCTDGFSGVCKPCLTIERRAKTGAKPRRKPFQDGQIECGLCGTKKAATEEFFYKQKDSPSGFTAQCKECCKAGRREYYKENKVIIRAAVREYIAKNKLKISVQRHERNLKNPEPNRQRAKRWRSANPDRHRLNARTRKARQQNAEGAYTIEDERLLYRTQKGLCWWCSKAVGNDYHVDHRIALDKGGTNWPENLCISCPKCNLSKNNKMPWEFNGRLL